MVARVDLGTFRPRPKAVSPYPRPILLYVGRVSHEKGIDDFLKLKTGGMKMVVGDGPARAALEREHRNALFLGYRKGDALGEVYASADLFVFPSRTDTFGIVLIEALASGLPVAAYPVTGPIDIVTRDELGALDPDLGRAVERALASGKPAACAEEGRGTPGRTARTSSWGTWCRSFSLWWHRLSSLCLQLFWNTGWKACATKTKITSARRSGRRVA